MQYVTNRKRNAKIVALIQSDNYGTCHEFLFFATKNANSLLKYITKQNLLYYIVI